MPFDGNPAKFTETKPDVFSLEGLIAWLERQPQETRYSILGVESCLWGAYTKAQGGRYENSEYIIGDRRMSVFMLPWPGSVMPQSFAAVANDGACTYGAALARARALLAERT